MDLSSLIAGLSRPDAYPHAVDTVQVIQTHISVVFLAGPFAYKIKKPVDFGFVDFSTLEKRLQDCREEVRLNRRLAADIYLGVVPIVGHRGGLCLEGEGEAVEWAVKMRRLPPGVTLHERLQAGEVTPTLIEAVARRVADFHRQSLAPPEMTHHSRANVVAGNIRELFAESAGQVGTTVSQAVFDRARILFETALERWSPLIDDRSGRGLTRDAHGDLHLEHVCVFADRAPPDDLVVIDCIEFNDRLRFIDPIADMAFVAMDLAFHGRRDLSRTFTEAYFRASRDEEGRTLLPLFTAYRAAVRGAVEGMKLAERELPEHERGPTLVNSRRHWLLALGELDTPELRPCLILVGGLPGTGKSTIAQALATQAGMVRVRSDEVRKSLAGVSAGTRLSPEGYSRQNTEKTYHECLRFVEGHLFEGGRVVVDATFRAEAHRVLFLEAARRWGVPVVWLLCQADPATIRERLLKRRGDVSDADWSIYLDAAGCWEELAVGTSAATRIIDANGTTQEAQTQALAVLEAMGLRAAPVR